MMAKLTIVTTTYNQEKYIGEALDSFIMQKTNFPFQVVISDDCSTDKTRDIISDYAKKYPNIIKPIFNKFNLGPMDNFVTTLSGVKTEYVALCDGDDYWTDEYKLQKQVDFLDSNKEYSMCFHQTKIFFENRNIKDQVWPVKFKKESNLEDLLKENFIAANTVVYRWRFIGEENLKTIFPQNIVPGDYYVHLLHAEIGKIGYIDEHMSNYRRHDSGMWWLNATPEGKEQFSIVYGEKFLNFYNEVEKHFKLDNNFFILQKKDIIYNAIRNFTKNNIIDKLKSIREKNKNIFDLCMKEIIEKNDRNSDTIKRYNTSISDEFYWSLSKTKKIPYLLFLDRKRLKEVIISKLKRS